MEFFIVFYHRKNNSESKNVGREKYSPLNHPLGMTHLFNRCQNLHEIFESMDVYTIKEFQEDVHNNLK